MGKVCTYMVQCSDSKYIYQHVDPLLPQYELSNKLFTAVLFRSNMWCGWRRNTWKRSRKVKEVVVGKRVGYKKTRLHECTKLQKSKWQRHRHKRFNVSEHWQTETITSIWVEKMFRSWVPKSESSRCTICQDWLVELHNYSVRRKNSWLLKCANMVDMITWREKEQWSVTKLQPQDWSKNCVKVNHTPRTFKSWNLCQCCEWEKSLFVQKSEICILKRQ